MGSTELRPTLLQELHRAIDDATRGAMGAMEHREAELTYPPGVELTDAERRALGELKLSPDLRSALEKVIRDAAGYPLFHLFTLLDAVTDPQDWSGL